MRLPRISISLPERVLGQAEQLPARPVAAPIRTITIDPQDVVARVASLSSSFEAATLTEEDLAAARRQMASIRLAWDDFQSNLEEDRMVLQIARRVEMLEILDELQRRHDGAVTHLELLLQTIPTGEVQA